jgi:hypothetical protein
MASGDDSAPRGEVLILVSFEMHAPRPARRMQVPYAQAKPIFSCQMQKDTDVIQDCKRILSLCHIGGTTLGSILDLQV